MNSVKVEADKGGKDTESSEDEFDEIVGTGEDLKQGIPRLQSNIQSKAPRKKVALDCNTCGKKLSSKHSLKDHKLRFHSKDGSVAKFSCMKCSFSSPVWHSVHLHTKEVHKPKEDMYKCSLCEYCAAQKSNLLEHFMAVHQKIKDQVCEHCGFATTRKKNLRKHIREVHLKIRPHQCTLCDFAAAQLNSLRSHVEMKHTKPPKRERTCFICVKLLSLKRSLEVHLKKQHSEGMSCSECHFNATDPFALNDHYEQLHRP